MTQPLPSTSPVFTRTQVLFLGTATLASIALAWLGRMPEITLGGDDSTYLLLAEALRSGQYVDVFLPNKPAHAQYPPMFPLFIAIVQTIAGASVQVVQFANILLLPATGILAAVAVARRFPANIATCAACLILLNPMLVQYAGTLVSESLFVCFVVAALAVLARPCDDIRASHWFLAFAFGLLSFFTRSVGIGTVLAVIGALFICRRFRVSLLGAAAILVLAGWFAYTRWATSHTLGWSYANDLAYINAREPLALVHEMLAKVRYYLAALPARVFALPDVRNMPLDGILWVAILGGLIGGGSWQLARKWPASLLFLLLCSGILLVFPFTVLRLLVPLIPILVIGLVLGLHRLSAWIDARRPMVLVVPVCFALGGLAIVHNVGSAVSQTRCRAGAPEGTCITRAEHTWFETARWMGEILPPDAVVASAKPSSLYRVSGHSGVPSRVLFLDSLENLFKPRGPITHIMASHLWAYERRDLPPALRSICGRLRLIPTPHSEVLLLEVLPENAPPETDGCAALVDFHDPVRDDGGPQDD